MVRVEVDLGWQGRRFCRVGRGARGDDFDGGCRRDGRGCWGVGRPESPVEAAQDGLRARTLKTRQKRIGTSSQQGTVKMPASAARPKLSQLII